MRLTLYIFVAILTVPAAFPAAASPPQRSAIVWEPPDWVFPENAKASIKKEMLTSLRVSGYDVVLEQTAMKDAQDRLGGEMGSKGDAGDALEWLCFRGTNENGSWVLWLESGEIDGGLVGSFQWRQVSKSDVFDARCHDLDAAAGAISLPVPNLKLGATQAQVLRSLGAPTSRTAARLIYVHEHDVTSATKRNDPFVSTNLLIVRLRNGIVWAIQASKTTSD